MSVNPEIDACMTATGVGAPLLAAAKAAKAAEAAEAAKIADLNASRFDADQATSSDGKSNGKRTGRTGRSGRTGRKRNVKRTVLPDPEAPSHDALREHFGDGILMIDGVDILTYLESGFQFNTSGLHPILCGLIVRSMYETYWLANGFEGHLNFAGSYASLVSTYDFIYRSTGATANYASHLTEFNISDSDPEDRDILTLVTENHVILNKVVAAFFNYIRNKFDRIDLTLDERNIVRVKLFSTYTGDRDVTEPGKALNDKARKAFDERTKSRTKPGESGKVIVDRSFNGLAKSNGAVGLRTGLTLREQARMVKSFYRDLKKYNSCIIELADHLGKVKRFYQKQQ